MQNSPPAAAPGDLRDYIKKHKVEPMLVEALKEAVDADSPDPAAHIGEYMLRRSSSRKLVAPPSPTSPHAHAAPTASETPYMASSSLRLARERTAWLLFFLCGLLACASVLADFEALLARELELAFFVPLLIGHGGNSGGQVVSTVIRALGSGAATLRDAPRVVAKEALAGVMQSLVLVCALAPALHLGMGISLRVTTVVSLSLPCLGLLANTLGSALPFAVTYFGRDPAVIVGPLMTTSVDSLGLSLYLLIATVCLNLMGGDDAAMPACHRVGFGCAPSNEWTSACKKVRGECVALPALG